MNDNFLEILLIEDEPADRLLLEEALEEVWPSRFALTHATRLDGALLLLRERKFDVVLLDLGLPDSQGLNTFFRLQREGLPTPILVLSGLDDEALAVCAVQEGAQDFLVKSKIHSGMLARTIRYSIERKRSEQELVASEVGYRRLFETAQDGIFILNAQTGEIIDANPCIEKLLGYPVSQFLGQRLWDIAPFCSSSASRTAASSFNEKGSLHYDVLPLLSRDGQQIYVEFSSYLFEAAGQRVFQCNLRDITLRKQAEDAFEALSRQTERRERMLSTALSSMSDFAQIYDRDGRFVFVNQPLLDLWALRLDEVVGKTYFDLDFPDALAKRLQQQVQQVFETKKRVTDETSYTHPTGVKGCYETIFLPVFEADGKVGFVVGSTRDMTERKRIAGVLEATLVQLERSNSELKHFASIASHDLQEPLRVIQAFSDRLQTKHSAALGEEAHDYLARIQKAAGRMRALIQDLLVYSRITTQVRPFVAVNLKDKVQAVLCDLTRRLEDTGGRVEIGELPTVEADRLQMRQLFQNLIDNGLKFHREEQPPLVRVFALPPTQNVPSHEPMVQIVVEDNGIGFDEKFVDRIFSPFERLHTQSKYSGTGIGLAICRKIAERHGGTISVNSVPGQGSRFVIVLPLRQPPPDPALERAASAPANAVESV